ncbi:MAG TPA: GTP-binding protein [Candidatus Coproplasma stercoripullorum]|uniref:GTP-binding protein n=1 Tax=Candidatus Coproplasma stercoripullorum TaxID=2840751 RepID=A0A9D1AF58_9FIRM|nr:GTP-binding protein [Candidatus Coproplasma stercoripullorum]
MTKIDIFSGFLGAGKTTLIKKLIKEAYAGEKLVLIENEFGDIGIDGGFLADAGIKINELNSGCICCSLVGDFAKALKKVCEEYHPDRILIEPSGVGKLSDVIRAVYSANLEDCVINTYTAIVDAAKCKMYMKNFGEFFNDQIETANCIIFTHADISGEEKLKNAVALVREHNTKATLVTTPWQQLSGAEILAAMEHSDTLEEQMEQLKKDAMERHEHDHDDDDDHDEHEHEHEHGHCCHHDHGDDDGHGHEHGHCCHHDHDDGDEHEHEHHHEHGEECGCGHHRHHHADEVFESWGVETAKTYSADELKAILSQLTNAVEYGVVLRAKGIVAGKDGAWLHFDYNPGEPDVHEGAPAYTGKLCVIGSKLDKEELSSLFGV